MDDNLKQQSAKQSITPEFSHIDTSGNNSSPKEKLNNKEDNASESLSGGGFKTNVLGKSSNTAGGKKQSKVKQFGKMGAGVAIGTFLLFAIFGIVLTPQFLVGTMDYNLQKVLGFGGTVGILEKQGEYVTATAMREGNVQNEYAQDLENNGIMVGQIASNGEFVRTNTFIADLGISKEVASNDVVYGTQEEGQLVIKYENEIIDADNFVAKVESEPRLYYAYSTALNIATRYYYSDEVTQYYESNGLSRNNFAGWTNTGDKEVDDAKFAEMLGKALDTSDMVGTNGLDMEWYEVCGKKKGQGTKDCEKIFNTSAQCESFIGDRGWDKCEVVLREPEENEICTFMDGMCVDGYKAIFENKSLEDGVSDFGSAEELSSAVSSGLHVGDDQTLATKKSTVLLNAAMSSNEPYVAAKSFLVVEESANRARVGDGGPINQVMDAMAEKNNIEVTDPDTGEKKIIYDSILNTTNFVAAASDGGPFSTEEAKYYSRDNVINTMNNAKGLGISDVDINGSATSSNTSKQANMLILMSHEGEAEDMSAVNSTLNNTFYGDPVDTFSTSVGGSRIPNGGSFLNSDINKNAIGALPSDEIQLASYNTEVEKILARKAEAERSSLSPFDISSPNTFFGSIVHGFGSAMIRSYGKFGGSSLVNLTSSVANLTGKSIASAMTGVYADGATEFASTYGDCPTPESTNYNLKGDIGCNTFNTVSTSHMEMTEEDYKNSIIGDSLDEEGNIKDGSELAEIAVLGGGRSSIPGTSNSDVCERYKQMHANALQKALAKVSNFVGVNQYVAQYKRCGDDDEREEDSEEGSRGSLLGQIGDFFGNLAEPDVPKEVATGAKYTLSSENEDKELMEYYSAYSMYQMVRSMITDEENEVTAFKNRYYAEYPLDNSLEGVISRRSGLSKDEVKIALNYASYLNVVANYNPEGRMVFGKVNLDIKVDLLPKSLKKNQDFNNNLALLVSSKNGLMSRRENVATA